MLSCLSKKKPFELPAMKLYSNFVSRSGACRSPVDRTVRYFILCTESLFRSMNNCSNSSVVDACKAFNQSL